MSERPVSTAAGSPTPDVKAALADGRAERHKQRRENRLPRILLLMVVGVLALCFFVMPACVDNNARASTIRALVPFFSMDAEFNCCQQSEFAQCSGFADDYLAVVQKAEAYATDSRLLFAWGRLNGLNPTMADDAKAWAKGIRDGYQSCVGRRR